MVSVTRRGNTFKALAAVAVAAIALGLGSSASAQLHGVQIGKSCESPRCVLDTTDCIILIGHADGFGDTIQINAAVDIIIKPPAGPAGDVRVPPVGNLPIISIEGNAFCSGVGCDQITGAGCTLPCRVGPANSVLSGLPGDPSPGIIRFHSNTYVIQPTDPNPLQDQATITVQDLCDSPTTSGCSPIANDVQFTASTVWCIADDNDECTVDACVDGVCTNDPICTVDPDFCDDADVCTADDCDETAPGCCEYTPIPCAPRNCFDNAGCDPILGCQYTSECLIPGRCNDQNVCTNDVCSEADPDCCINTVIPCAERTCFDIAGCHPVNGCQYTSECLIAGRCNDNNVCTSDVCSETDPDCCINTVIPCPERTCFDIAGCHPVNGCQYTSECTDPNRCNDNNVCTTDVCNTNDADCCINTPIVCPPRPCEELIGCDPVLGCQYESVCSDPTFCDDNNVCTSDVCNPSALDCCDNTVIPCPPLACQINTGCHPTLGCQYDSVCENPFFCNDNNACTTETCDVNEPDCCVTTEVICEPRPCFTTLPCNPATGCQYEPIVCPPPGGSCQFSQCNPATGVCEISGVNCNDGNECTEDICDPITGCRFEPIACCESECEPITKAHFDIWNENERKLSGTYRCIAAWDQELLSRYTPNGLANNLLRPNLQTDKGKARIDGLRSQQCEENCFRDPKSGEPIPIEDVIDLFGEDVEVVCSEDNPLLGVAAKVITFPGAGTARAGSELVGMGYQAGQIAYDLLGGSPPTAAAGVVTPDDFVKSIRSTARGGSSTLLLPEQTTSPSAGLDDPPIPVGIGRGSTTQKGSLVVYTKVEIKWDAAGNVIQDTFLTLTNDFTEEVTVQLYFVHGDLCTWVDNAFILTPNQSVYWSVLTGQPIGASPFTVLEERCPDDDPENPGGTRMRGYVLAWAVDPITNQEIRFNHLSGTGMLLNYRDVTAWEYNAWAFQATEAVAHGAILFPPYGRLDVNGIEYQSAPDQLLLDFFASGAMINPGGIGTVSIDTDLTLWIFDADLRENTGAPFEPNGTPEP